MGDGPHIDNSTKAADVHVMKRDPDVQKLYDQIFGAPDMSNKSAKPTQDVGGVGQIAAMRLPSSWQAGDSTSGVVGNSMFREYHSKDNPEVKMCFSFRGHRTSEEAAKAFHNILSEPPHMLKLGELDQLKEVLGNLGSSDFTTLVAKTEDLNGKRVLSVEGTYSKWDLTTKHLFVDADNTGSAVQEVYFLAPKADYVKSSLEAKKAFDSIIWK